MHKPILLDCDGVFSDFTGAALKLVKKFHNVIYDPAEITKKVSVSVKEWDDQCENAVKEKGFCLNLDLLPNAQRGIRRMKNLAKDYNRKIMFLTSPYWKAPHWPFERTEWIEKHFGFTRENVILAKEKRFVAGSVLIDDEPTNIQNWISFQHQNGNPEAVAVLFSQPWNQDAKIPEATMHTDNWDDIYTFLKNEFLDYED